MAIERHVLGMIAYNDSTGRGSVFINSNSAIQYMVRPLMYPRDDYENLTGYISSFEEEIDFRDQQYLDDERRIENFLEWINDWLMMFVYRENEGLEYAKAKRICLVPKPSSVTENSQFCAIPVFSPAEDEITKEWSDAKRFQLWRDYSTLDDFKENIRRKQSVGSIYGYDLDEFRPSFVIWRDAEGKLFAIGGFTDIEYNDLGGIMIEGDDIVKIDMNEYLNYIVYDMNANPTIIFIPISIYEEIENRIVRDLENRSQAAGDIWPAGLAGIREIHEENGKVLWEIDTSVKNDELVINAMDYYSQKNDLYYSRKDLVNVHTAIKCSNLVILSGLSGTGKSKLVEMYAKSLGVCQSSSPDKNRLLIIPVRPSWNDDADLLGYVDLVHMEYRVSDTGFVDLLVSAQKEENRDKLYIVCFDEMNLARVEHYFSQFLSILERPARERELQLYDSQYAGRLGNAGTYPSRIKVGENVRFVGTVNIDETTYHFSDKVLDRADVIQLNVLNYAEEWNAKSYVELPEIVWSGEDYAGLVREAPEDDRYTMQLHSLLWDIHQLMQSASSKHGIGPRIVKAIGKYIVNLPMGEIDGFDRRLALDYQIVQRVLTKVRGPESQLGDIVKRQSESNFCKIFEKYDDLSDFENCKKVLEQKEKELEVYGYCI